MAKLKRARPAIPVSPRLRQPCLLTHLSQMTQRLVITVKKSSFSLRLTLQKADNKSWLNTVTLSYVLTDKWNSAKSVFMYLFFRLKTWVWHKWIDWSTYCFKTDWCFVSVLGDFNWHGCCIPVSPLSMLKWLNKWCILLTKNLTWYPDLYSTSSPKAAEIQHPLQPH